MLLTGIHFTLRHLVYRNLVSRLGTAIGSDQVGIGYFPPAVELHKLKDVEIPGLTRLSCDELRVSMPLWALLTSRKPLDLLAVNPRLKIDSRLLEKLESRSKPSAQSSFYLRRLRVEKGNLSWFEQSSKTAVSADSIQIESIAQQEGGALKVTIPHAQLDLSLSGEKVRLLGQLRLEIKRLPETVSVRNLEWRGEELNLYGSGRYFLSDKSFVFRSTLQAQLQPFLKPIIDEFAPQASAYGDLVLKKDAGQGILAQVRLNATHFTLRGQSFDKLAATLNWDSRSREIVAKTEFSDPTLHSGLDVNAKPGGVELQVRNLAAEKVVKIIDIADIVPLSGVLASARILIHGSQIGGSAVLEQGKETGRGFNLSGPVEFSYHTKSKETHFSCKKGRSELGDFRLNGMLNPKQAHSMDIDVAVAVDNLRLADVYSRHYIDLDLARWRLGDALGQLDVSVSEYNDRMSTESSFILEELTSSEVPLRHVSGRVTSRGKRVEGHMDIRDEKISGDADFLNLSGETVIDFKAMRGGIETALKLLDLELDLQGQGQGDFRYRQLPGRGVAPTISGDFRADSLRLVDFPFEKVSGKLWSDTKQVRLDDLRYEFYGGSGQTELLLDYPGRRYRIDGSVQGLDCNVLHREFNGKGSCRFHGQGEFFRDPIQLELSFPEMAFYPDRPFALEVRNGTVLSDFENFKLDLRGSIRRLGIESPLELKLESQDDRYNGTFSAAVNDLNLLIPWKDNQGEMKLEVRIGTGREGQLDFQGVANFNGQRLAFPGFAHTVDDFEGFVTINNGQFTLQSFQGRLGGGPVGGNGFLAFSGESIRDLSLNIRGQSMTLYPMDRAKCTIDADLSLKQNREGFLLSGQIDFLDALWERGLTEGFSFNTDADFSSSESAFLDRLGYDLRLQSKGTVAVRNSLIEAQGAFDLQLVGNFDRPLITGSLEARSGTFSLGDKKFAISKAKVLYNNPFIMDPVIQFDSETFVQNYRIRFLVSGAMSHLTPQLISSPPLPQQDIWALMSQGELFERPTSSELSSRMGTAGLISGVLLEDVQKRAKALFGIDILRLEPDTENALVEGGSRVTIGTSIARNVIIVYSTKMSTSRREVLYVHYQLSPAISLVGMRNEDGYFSIDIRFRKRY